MIRNDYIMKMIQQLVKALAVILKLKEAGRHDDAAREIDAAMQRICGLNSQLVNALSEESLVSTLKGGVTIDHGKALVLAELLTEEGDVFEGRGDEAAAFARYYKALYLYLEVFAGEEEFRLPDYTPKVDALVARLEDFVLPTPAMARLVTFYEREGDFAAAEDALDLMLEEDDSDDARELARAFYTRLLERSDDELGAGNFTRAEATEGLARVG
jgi:tetratricopeptide (TPR) repeat protein